MEQRIKINEFSELVLTLKEDMSLEEVETIYSLVKKISNYLNPVKYTKYKTREPKVIESKSVGQLPEHIFVSYNNANRNGKKELISKYCKDDTERKKFWQKAWYIKNVKRVR